MLRRLTLIVLSTLLPAVAFAQNAVVPGALELYPNLEAVGARLATTGDANANASGWLEWRTTGAATWNRGADLVRITNGRFAASVFWLQPGVDVEVRAVISDPDGGGATVSGSTRTRVLPPTVPTGRAWWVAVTGSDSAAGTSSAPLRTLAYAASRAQPGDEIRVRPGVYYQTLDTPRSGTPAAPIHLVADQPGVVLDGSDPAMLRRTDWRDDAGGVFSVPFTATTRLVCADSLQRLHRKATLADLRAGTDGVAQGWVIEGGRLYVKLEDGSSPNGHVMHVARYENGIWIDESDWHVTGFEVRYYGLTIAAGGIHLRGASRCLIRGNTVFAIGGKYIWVRVGGTQNVIESNICRDPRIGTWPWAACKAHEEELQGIAMRGGRGNVVRWNRIESTFDGIDLSDGETDENAAADCDISENEIRGTADDALEPESISGINTRLWKNSVLGTFSGISLAPTFVGPIYVVRNTFQDYRRGGVKLSISGASQTYFLHNTFVSSVGGTSAVYPSGPYSNVHFRNNVLMGTGSAAVSDDAGESQTGCDFNGDLLTSDYAALFRWKGVNYSTLAALRSATGFESAGSSGAPMFANRGAGDLRLLAGSPGVDAAIRLYGINDGFQGSGPDCGAFETGAVAGDQTPPAPIGDLDAR